MTDQNVFTAGPARRSVLLAGLGAAGAAVAAPFVASAAHAATVPLAAAPPTGDYGTYHESGTLVSTSFQWPDRSPVVATVVRYEEAAETTAYSYVVDRALPKDSGFSTAAVLPTGRIYGWTDNGLHVLDQATPMRSYFGSLKHPVTKANKSNAAVVAFRQRLAVAMLEDGGKSMSVYHLLGEGKAPEFLGAFTFGAEESPALISYLTFSAGVDERGKEVVRVQTVGKGNREHTFAFDGSGVISRTPAPGRRSVLAAGGDLRWSNDGPGGSALQLFTASGSSQTQLRVPQGINTMSGWLKASPDRRQIVLQSVIRGTMVADLQAKKAWYLISETYESRTSGQFAGSRYVFATESYGDRGFGPYVQDGIYSFDTATGKVFRIKDSLKVGATAVANGNVAAWDHNSKYGVVDPTWVRSVRFTS